MTSQFPVYGIQRVGWQNAIERDAKLSSLTPRLPWDKFVRTVFDPVPGEHVGILGPTGQGKTVLQNNILPFFPFVAVFATKPVDNTMDELIREGNYVRLNKWYQLNPIDSPRRVIWPDARSIHSADRQRAVFTDAMEKIFREGGRPAKNPVGWAIAIDELWYFTNILKLGTEVKMILLQGRSLGVSLIAATQRPAFVPLEVYDQSTHLFFFRDNDETNLDRIGRINAKDRGLIKNVVSNLDRHQVLYVNTRSGAMARTHAPKPKG